MRGDNMAEIVLLVSLLFISTPSLASDNNRQGDVPLFTDQDLEEYKSPSDIKESHDDLEIKKDETGLENDKKTGGELSRPEKSFSPPEDRERPYSDIRAILYRTST
jgi:hypothetical protein